MLGASGLTAVILDAGAVVLSPVSRLPLRTFLPPLFRSRLGCLPPPHLEPSPSPSPSSHVSRHDRLSRAEIASRLLLLQVLAIALCIGWLYRWQLRAIAATWRMIHSPTTHRTLPCPEEQAGRARDVTRGGGPSEGRGTEVLAVEQLIVGVLLFTPAILLLPTTAVYAAFFGEMVGGEREGSGKPLAFWSARARTSL